jgi:Family of unknown function (DUF5990)
MATDNSTSIHLRILHDGAGPPGWMGSAKDFGLQDKGEVLHPAKKAGKDRIAFDLTVRVEGEEGKDTPNFLGSFTHGTPKDRFLYLGWRHPSGTGWTWRLKLPLGTITWKDVRAARKSGNPLVADATGRGPGGGRRPIEWRLAAD